MHPLINLVATRQKSGTPVELLRWYNDHVSLLMRFDGLVSATLYRCQQAALRGDFPEYICLYRFASPAAFAAFEASPAKELARQVTASGWGQRGIEIIQRSQYPLSGQWTGGISMSSTATTFHIQCLNLTPAPDDAQNDIQRWLADSLHQTANAGANRASLQHYQWLSSAVTDTLQQAVVLASLSDPALAWQNWWTHHSDQSQTWGQPPSAVEVVWQAGYEFLCQWQR